MTELISGSTKVVTVSRDVFRLSILMGGILEGWWRYDDRTSEDIEQAFEMKLNQFQILICGELYVIDLDAKVQYPKRDPCRKRSIKRDVRETPCKGVAGII